MAKQKAKVNKGPYIKNANLIGKGGGQVKPVEGSFVKGVSKARPKVPPANPSIKRHISTQPAKTTPDSAPARRRQLSATKQASAPKVVTKPTQQSKVTAKKAPSIPKATPKVVTAKKAPSKAAIAKVQSKARQQAAPKKAAPQKTVAKKAPVKGR
jgi:hypothetical protein